MNIYYFIIIFLFFYGCKGLKDSSLSTLDHAIKKNYHVKNDDLVEWIKTTKYLIISDRNTNRTAIFYKTKLIDSFVTISGKLDKYNNSLTKLGVFTLHALEYCPLWIPSANDIRPGCQADNFLGNYSLWYDGYTYGFHGFPKRMQSWFNPTVLPDSRRQSEGCIVAGENKLQEFVDLLIEDEQLKNHQAVLKMLEYRASADDEKRKQNVLLPFIDDYGYQPEWPQPLMHIKWPIIPKIDAKLIVIDTKYNTLPAINNSDNKTILTAEKNANEDAGIYLARTCQISNTIDINNNSGEISENSNILNTSDIISGVGCVFESGPYGKGFKVELENGSTGWIRENNYSSIKCDKKLYFHSKHAKVIQDSASNYDFIHLNTNNIKYSCLP